MEDSGDVLEVWPKRRGPGYFAIVVISIVMSALVVVGAQLALVRWPGLQTMLGAKPDRDRGKVEVPGLTKIPLEAASQVAEARGVKLLSVGGAADPDVPPGWVVEQTPAAGTKVRRGRTVNVKLSSGPPLVPVPAVAGVGLLEAQQRLLQAGLRVGGVETTGASLRVKGTRPPPGEQAVTGAPVTLILEVAPDADAAATEEGPAGRRNRR